MPNGSYNGTDRIGPIESTVATLQTVAFEIGAFQDGSSDQEEISDPVALAIIEQYMLPRSGPFTDLFKSYHVSLEKFFDYWAFVRENVAENEADREDLDYLATWALNHESRKAS